MRPVSLDPPVRYGFLLTGALVFLLLALRNWWVPFNHDEAATFFYYIQSGEFLPYQAHVDANNHVLNSGLAYYCFKLFGSSPFALRLPNLITFLILLGGVYRLLFHLKNRSTQVFLVAGLLLSFHWIGFFNVARGYGMSMAFLVLALAFLLDYLRTWGVFFLYGILLSLQLAMAANLTLILVTVWITLILIFYQILHKRITDYRIWPGYLLHFFLLKFWINFSFFLKDHHALYYGEGDSYWEITFKTLLGLLAGTENETVILLLGIITGLLVIIGIIYLFKTGFWDHLRRADPVFVFVSLVLATAGSFFILHIWKDINYPEDRTALFFYPLVLLVIVFLTDLFFKGRWTFIFPLLFVFHFIFSVNLRTHSMPEYETFPERFYTRLVEEQEKSKEKMTIGGHRLVELMFAFMNYNHGAPLNLADDGETMNLRCDYGIAKKKDEERYSKLYETIDQSEWDFVLLKRKKKAETREVVNLLSNAWQEGSDEFYEFFRAGDTTSWPSEPLRIEFDFDIDHASQPFNGWLVVQVDDATGKNNSYKRIPLNWLKYSWNQTKNATITLVTPELPEQIKSVVIYLWNQKKQFVRIKMNGIRIHQYKPE